jgi:hypothetical protein
VVFRTLDQENFEEWAWESVWSLPWKKMRMQI